MKRCKKQLSNKYFYKYPPLFILKQIKLETIKINERGYILTRTIVYLTFYFKKKFAPKVFCPARGKRLRTPDIDQDKKINYYFIKSAIKNLEKKCNS